MAGIPAFTYKVTADLTGLTGGATNNVSVAHGLTFTPTEAIPISKTGGVHVALGGLDATNVSLAVTTPTGVTSATVVIYVG